MKLKVATVTNYRSVENSDPITIDDLTCLVGKNEAGKTAILYALAGLNPHPATPIAYDKETDYPRRFLNDYKERHPHEEATVIDTWWELSESQRKKITDELGNGALADLPTGDDDAIVPARARIYRRYGDTEAQLDQPPIDYLKVIENVVKQSEFDDDEMKAVADATTSDELRKILEALPEKTERQKRLLERINAWPGKNASGFARSVIRSGLPKMMYFSHYDRMAGQLRVDDLPQREGKLDVGETVFLDFLEFAGTSVEEINKATTYETLNARCEGASIAITDQLREYWRQNPHLEIEVRFTKAEPNDKPPFNAGTIARARVKNALHRVSVPFSERSAGFIWFFSFLVKFSRVKAKGGDLLLLLDEPGLTLHGKAQEDLLRYFAEKLIPSHQLIFSTHSPFMVPADDLLSARIVEDRAEQKRPGIWTTEGTKVRADVLAVDPDTLFPLQGALGYEVTQTLFLGKHTLLVEGPGDLLFLKAFSSALKRKKKEILDPRWTICPAGGIDKIQSFVSLFAGANLQIAALTDFQLSDRKKVDALRKSKIIADNRLLNFATLLGLAEADIEDIFDRGLYVQIVNSAFELAGADELTVAKLDAAATGAIRLLKQTENACKLLSATAPEFDHFTPAEWLIQNPTILEGKSAAVEKTLERASVVISALNKLLPEKA